MNADELSVRKSTVIFLICYMSYVFIYVGRLNLSMASPVLAEGNVLDAAQIGLLGSVFSVVYALGRLVNGGFSDRVAPYVMVCSGLVLSGISNIAVGLFPPFIGILILWGVNAYAQSMLWSSLLCVISSVYDERQGKQKTSLLVTSVAVGNIAGILLNTFLIERFSVQFAFIIPGAITILCSIFVFSATGKIKPLQAKKVEHIPMFRLIENRKIRMLVLPSLFHGVMKDNISLWMAVYFVSTFSIDLQESTWFVLFIPLVGFIGRMIYPFCYKMAGENEHKVSLGFFRICALAAVPLCMGNVISPVLAVICLSVIYAAVSVINTSILSIFPMEFLNTGNVASVSGIMDFLSYLGAGIGSAVYGVLIKHVGYSPMFLSWVMISLLSMGFVGRIVINKV